MTFKFRSGMQQGDKVVTYDTEKREYLIGKIIGDYEYGKKIFDEFPHTRRVEWLGRISRDSLRTVSKNTLGSTLTIFEPGEDVLKDLESALSLKKSGVEPEKAVEEEKEEEFEVIRRDTLGRAHEFIKDRILALEAEEMEYITAALLQAMGYKSRVTPKGPDRGRDVIASPDGLGFQQPRIFAEVKHRPKDQIGSDKIRSFIGSLRDGDKGLYVSTGGFSKEAKYEADRASIPVTLIDLDDLAHLIVEHYENFSLEGRQLIPLIRVYWPIAD